jgi:hypothetical protein
MSDDLPEVYSEPTDSGFVTIVANKKARRFINECFDSPLRWNRVKSEYLTSPKYRAVGIGDGPVPQAILSHCHQAGFKTMFMCAKCSELHVMDDEKAERLLFEATAMASEAMPEHPTSQ